MLFVTRALSAIPGHVFCYQTISLQRSCLSYPVISSIRQFSRHKFLTFLTHIPQYVALWSWLPRICSQGVSEWYMQLSTRWVRPDNRKRRGVPRYT